VKQEEIVSARQRLCKHVSPAVGTHMAIEDLFEATFSMQSILKPCNENQMTVKSQLQAMSRQSGSALAVGV
jgi:hypothetical protein